MRDHTALPAIHKSISGTSHACLYFAAAAPYHTLIRSHYHIADGLGNRVGLGGSLVIHTKTVYPGTVMRLSTLCVIV